MMRSSRRISGMVLRNALAWRWWFPMSGRLAGSIRGEAGMSTVEYAIGTVAAAGFAAVLYTVLTGGSVVAALEGLVQRALSVDY